MKIEKKEIRVGDIWDGFKEDLEDGSVRGLNGKLDIRPPYQREFVYNLDQQKEVLNTAFNNFPLNVMYWAKTPTGYEVLDGQQRTLSLMNYLNHGFSINRSGKILYESTLTKEEMDQLLDYKLDVYICDGTDREKLDWFRVVNIAGEKLTDQELKNSVYAGPWLSQAKRYFSKRNGMAFRIGSDYLKGSAVRQDYLETALKWITQKDDLTIEEYMGNHQFDQDSKELENYFEEVIEWASNLFPDKDSNKKGLDWGRLYEECKDNDYNPDELKEKLLALKKDDEVTNKRGIYEYLLSGNERSLNLRQFSNSDKETAYYKAGGKCQMCGKEISLENAQADHIKRWSEGGKTLPDNLQILCRECNARKG